MMLRKTECYVPVCDICHVEVDDDAEMMRHFDTEAEAMEVMLEREDYGGGDCQIIDDQLCCPKCWCYNDDDEIALREPVDSTVNAKDSTETPQNHEINDIKQEAK